MMHSLKTLFSLFLVAMTITLNAAQNVNYDVVASKNKNHASVYAAHDNAKDGKQKATPKTTSRYYYYWSHSKGKPHPEDLILVLQYKSGVGLETVRFISTSDEYDLRTDGYLPGFWLLKAYVGKDAKVSDGIYTLNFYTQGQMIYDHPVDVRFKENDDPWKSGKYQVWRYSHKAKPRVMTYTLQVDGDSYVTLSGNGRAKRRFVSMDETTVRSLNRNTYDAKLLAANRRVDPVDDPRLLKQLENRTINYPDSSYYKGAVTPTNDGRYNPHGYGCKVWANGMTYEGEWKNGSPQGKGVMTWASGGRYEGEWVDGKRTGKGKRTWPSGDWLEGTFVNGVMSGYGKGYWADTDGEYEGYFADGKRSGQGVMRWGEKSKWPGDRYEGQWEEGWRTGEGTYYYANGRVEKGLWKENVLVKPEQSDKDSTKVIWECVFDRPASFPGGQQSLKNWLSKNVVYKSKWKRKGITGRVIVAFTVDSLGSIHDAKVVRSVHKELDEEALRLVSIMPQWVPAQAPDGTFISSLFNLPLYFGEEKER